MTRRSSLLWHYTYGAVVTAFCAVAGLIGVVSFQLEASMERQEAELLKLTRESILTGLSADMNLTGRRLEDLFRDTLHQVMSIAERGDTSRAVESHNVVAIHEVLGPVAKRFELDAIVVLDDRGRVIGSSRPDADLVMLDTVVHRLGFFGEIKTILDASYPGSVLTLSRVLPVAETGVLLPGDRVNDASQILFAPVFDDFGFVVGGLLGQRWLRESEPVLVDLAEISAFELALLHEGKLLSRANFRGTTADIATAPGEPNIARNGKRILQCGTPLEPFTVCALLPISALTAAQAQMTRISHEEQAKLFHWLFLFAAIALVLFAVGAFLLALRVTRPLTEITGVLAGIARGDYGGRVAGTSRQDEVGDIARSVVSLQSSVRERDALRARVNEKNAILRDQEALLREQNIRFDAALNNMSHGLCMFDAAGCLIVSNPRLAELFDLDSEILTPGLTAERLAELKAAEALDSETPLTSNHGGDDDGGADTLSTRMERTRSGRVVLTTRQPLQDGGWVAISEDITERQIARDRLSFLARHDLLTQLPNRVGFRDRIDTLLRRQRKEGGTFAVLCIDLDEFKSVNDSLGHPIGDELLRQVADRLRGLCGDRHVAVRLGGDEFALLTCLPAGRRESEELAETAIRDLSQPFRIADHDIVIGASVGIALAEGGTTPGDELFKQADLALYRAKEDGRNTHRVFEDEMGTAVRDRRSMIADLRAAIANEEFELHFQPQYELKDYSISGFEALLRWKSPTRGLVPPSDFVPLAEDTGLIIQIGEWVLDEACRIAAGWPDTIRISVNLSPRQLRGHAFAPVLLKALTTHGLSPERLELEVTETVLLTDSEDVINALLQAKALGVKVSMDDFGTGYSSLSYLRRFPFDKIKIDQSFVRSMTTCADSVSIVRAVIDLARNLDMATTAEGVETGELLEMLAEIGCTEAQGYHLGRPMSAASAEALLRGPLSTASAAAR